MVLIDTEILNPHRYFFKVQNFNLNYNINILQFNSSIIESKIAKHTE